MQMSERMNKPINVVDGDWRQCQNLCKILLEQDLLPVRLYCALGLDRYVQRTECAVTIHEVMVAITSPD